jgi:hypothetical protein
MATAYTPDSDEIKRVERAIRTRAEAQSRLDKSTQTIVRFMELARWKTMVGYGQTFTVAEENEYPRHVEENRIKELEKVLAPEDARKLYVTITRVANVDVLERLAKKYKNDPRATALFEGVGDELPLVWYDQVTELKVSGELEPREDGIEFADDDGEDD